MTISAASSNLPVAKAPKPSKPPEDKGQVYVTGDGFVQNFGPIASSNGTLRVYDSGVAEVLAKDIVLKDGLKIHDDTASGTVSFQRPDGAKVDFQHSELKLPYTEDGTNHSSFEVRTDPVNNTGGIVEDVYSDGDWKLTQYEVHGTDRQDHDLAWKPLSPDQRWTQLQKLADANNAHAAGYLLGR
jgi:hypothetical protein